MAPLAPAKPPTTSLHPPAATNPSSLSDDALLALAHDPHPAALPELIRRYLPMVLAAATRQLADPHAAEDIAQAVFTLLARKIHTIRSSPQLAGWLMLTTRNLSLNHLKMDSRRKKHERAAAAERDELLPSHTDTPDWSTLAPNLDTALARLPDPDRQALLLRFFRGLSLRETGVALGLSEDAARKRVSRALERLRPHLVSPAAPGTLTSAAPLAALPLSTTALESLLTAHAAPAVSSTTLAAVTATATTASLTPITTFGVLMASKLTQTALVAAVLAVLGIGTTSFILSRSPNSPAPQPVASVSPSPAAPADNPTQWRPLINALYTPAPDADVQLVPEPFPPERLAFYRSINPQQADLMPDGPDVMVLVLQRDGTFDSRFMSFGSGPYSLRDITVHLGKFRPYQIIGDPELLETTISGDWVLSSTATRDKTLANLASIFSTATNQTLRIVPIREERDVVVITGRPPAASAGSMPEITVFVSDRIQHNRSAVGPMATIADALSRNLDIPFIDESTPTGLTVQLNVEPETGVTLDQSIDRLAKELKLTFTRQRRMLDLYRIEVVN